MGIDAERADRLNKILECFEEVDIRIPQRIVGVENEIQRRLGAPFGRNRHCIMIVTTTEA